LPASKDRGLVIVYEGWQGENKSTIAQNWFAQSFAERTAGRQSNASALLPSLWNTENAVMLLCQKKTKKCANNSIRCSSIILEMGE